MRRWSLVIREFSGIEIITSFGATHTELVRFVQERESWLREKIEKHLTGAPPFVPTFAAGERFPFLGAWLTLSPKITPLARSFVKIECDRLCVYIPEQDWLSRDRETPDLVRQFYIQQADKVLQERLNLWSGEMLLKPEKVIIKTVKSRWGSLNSRKKLLLNRKLVLAPREVVDSVVVHELAHLRHFDHSKNFWALVTQFSPQHRLHSQWLQQNRHLFHHPWF